MTRTAIVDRMVLPDHECPFDVRAMRLLKDAGYDVEEHVLRSREEVDAYKRGEGVETTPQVFIDGQRVGGADDLEVYLAQAAA